MWVPDQSPDSAGGSASSRAGESESKQIRSLSNQIAAAILDAKPDEAAVQRLTSMYQQEELVDRATVIGLHRDLVRVYVNGEGFRHTPYNSQALNNPDLSPLGALASDQMAVLLQYLRLLVPFGVDSEGTLVGRIPLLLQLDAPQLTGFVKPLARTLAKESSVFCAKLIDMEASTPPGSLHEDIFSLMIGAVEYQPARFYDAIVSRVQAGVGVAHTFPLLGSLVKRKANIVKLSQHRLHNLLLEHLQTERQLPELLTATFSTCLLLPRFQADLDYRIERLFDVFMRLLRWPRSPDGAPLLSSDAETRPSRTAPYKGWGDALEQCLWAVLQSLYWTFPGQTLQCIARVEADQDRDQIYSWFAQLPLHPHLAMPSQQQKEARTSGDIAAIFADITPIGKADGAKATAAVMAAALPDQSIKTTSAESDGGADAAVAVGCDDILQSLPEDSRMARSAIEEIRRRSLNQKGRGRRVTFEAALHNLQHDLVSLSKHDRDNVHREVLSLRAQVLFVEYLRSNQAERGRQINQAFRSAKAKYEYVLAAIASDETRPGARAGLPSRSQPPPPPMMTHHSGEQSQSHMGALSVVLNDQATTQWEQDRARILNELDRFSNENSMLRDQNKKLLAELDPDRSEVKRLEVELREATAELALLKAKEENLRDGAVERKALDDKVGDLTSMLMGWEDELAQGSKMADFLQEAKRDMDLLSERSQAMENEVAAGRVLLADKEVRLLAELAQKAKLQDKCEEVTGALDRLSEVLDHAQMVSAAKLRAVQHKYSTVKQINIALETRLLDLQCEIEQQRAMTSAAQQDSAAAATAADAPDAGATDADAADADDVDIATDA